MILIALKSMGTVLRPTSVIKQHREKGRWGIGIKTTEALAGQGLDPAAEPGLGPSNYTAFSSLACLYANQPYL